MIGLRLVSASLDSLQSPNDTSLSSNSSFSTDDSSRENNSRAQQSNPSPEELGEPTPLTPEELERTPLSPEELARAQQSNISLNANISQIKTEAQLSSFTTILGTSIVAIAVIMVVPLILHLFLLYRQRLKMNSKAANDNSFLINQLYRVLVAIGVTFTVVLVIVYLNSLIWFNEDKNILNSLLETQKNFLTIIGTAFASLVAFYFGSRGTQRSNVDGTEAVKRQDLAQKAPEVIDVNPIDGSAGVEVNSQVRVVFSTPIRSSSINENTFSVRDYKDNFVQGKITVTDNDTIIVFSPVANFEPNSKYSVAVKKGIVDKSGTFMISDMVWRFTTAK